MAFNARMFWAKVDRDGPVPDAHPDLGPCWLWTGLCFNTGYGAFGGGPRPAHRVAYELTNGAPPEDGLQLHHLCENKRCVNPAHLEAVTPRDHAREHAKGITHCPEGHEYTVDNTYVRASGQRVCRRCDWARNRKRRQDPTYREKERMADRARKRRQKEAVPA